MSDKRFVIKSTATELELYDNDVKIGEFPHFEWVAKSVDSVVDLLNEQQDTIITLKRRLEKINGGYGNLTHYKGLTANEWLIQGQERELKKKDKQISEWIEQHSKDIVKISEQQATISKQLDQIIELQDKYRILEFNHSRLEKRNKAQYEKIDEQQTIINKLKEENKQLKEEIKPLKQKEEVLNKIWRNYLETHKYIDEEVILVNHSYVITLFNSLNDELEESSAFIIEQRKENGELRKKLREDIAFKDKHISYFKNLIGDIEIEFKLKENLSKEKWEEIHEKNYQNFRFGSGDNER